MSGFRLPGQLYPYVLRAFRAADRAKTLPGRLVARFIRWDQGV